LGFYTKLLDDPKNELSLAPIGSLPDPQSIKVVTFSEIPPTHPPIQKSKKHVTMDTFFELIKQQDVKGIKELLETDQKYEMEAIDKEWGSLPIHGNG
jgi:hypothetical protein